MTDHSTLPAGRNGPWRLLILDRDPGDPKWLFVTVDLPRHVRPAALGETGRCADWAEVTAWVARMFPGNVSLVPVQDPAVWRIDEGGPR